MVHECSTEGASERYVRMQFESFEYESIRAKNQQMLLDFMRTELEMGRTFVQSAALAKDAGHMDHCAHSTANAVKAADCVRRFKSQISDEDIRADISNKLAELDRLIGTL